MNINMYIYYINARARGEASKCALHAIFAKMCTFTN